jgi:hypothetical protein
MEQAVQNGQSRQKFSAMKLFIRLRAKFQISKFNPGSFKHGLLLII